MGILDIKVRHKDPKTGKTLVLTTTVLGDMDIFQINPYSFYSLAFKLEGPIILKEDGVAYTLHTDAEKIWGERPEISKVYFNDPATVVLWKDGTKTVVKAYDEEFDKEKGLAMAIVKKLHNNKGNFNDLFRKWIPE